MDEKTSKEGEIELKTKGKSEAWEFIKFTVIALLIVIPLRTWIAQPFIVHGSSMEPTFQNGDYLIVDEISYRFQKPQRNDVIIFRYPLNPSQFFIKRISGLPGEAIDGVTLKKDEYFVLGDNYFASSDSRSWGPLKSNFIVGRALVRLWPFANLGFL